MNSKGEKQLFELERIYKRFRALRKMYCLDVDCGLSCTPNQHDACNRDFYEFAQTKKDVDNYERDKSK